MVQLLFSKVVFLDNTIMTARRTIMFNQTQRPIMKTMNQNIFSEMRKMRIGWQVQFQEVKMDGYGMETQAVIYLKLTGKFLMD